MSGTTAPQNTTNAKATTDESTKTPQVTDAQGKKVQLEEDDEFEDFPVEDWPEAETSVPEGNAHLWEESWDDDDDTSEDFAQLLKEELKKVDANGKR